jgi:hypothetical protein
VSFARRPQPAASRLRRDDARPIDDVRAIGSAAARLSGGDDAFRSHNEPQRPALHARCYRIPGPMHDAEDALHNTLLRAWGALPKVRGQKLASHHQPLHPVGVFRPLGE